MNYSLLQVLTEPVFGSEVQAASQCPITIHSQMFVLPESKQSNKSRANWMKTNQLFPPPASLHTASHQSKCYIETITWALDLTPQLPHITNFS
jgi:hypothetical protein